MSEQREFRGVWFPADIWLDKNLTALDKFILMEIDSLDGENGCYASNEYIANFCQCSQTKVSTTIAKLKKLGYVEVESFDGRKRVLRSCLSLSVGQTFKNCKADSQNLKERILEKNTREEKEQIPFSEIVEYLNQKAGTRYRASTPKTQYLIRARWREGFGIDDFRHVIDIKCSEWIGTDYERYLRPETLFGTKFESYLNQQEKRKVSTDGIPEYLRDYDL